MAEAEGSHVWASMTPTPQLPLARATLTQTQQELFLETMRKHNLNVGTLPPPPSLHVCTLPSMHRMHWRQRHTARLSFLTTPTLRLQEEEFLGALADMPQRNLKKLQVKGKEDAVEAMRFNKVFGVHNIAAHKAAKEYLDSKGTNDKFPRKDVCEKYEITESMMRTAEAKQQDPYQSYKPGPKPLIQEHDFLVIGNHIMDSALRDQAVTPPQLRAMLQLVADEAKKRRGQDVSPASNTFLKTQTNSLFAYWSRLGVELCIQKKGESKQAARARAEKYAPHTFTPCWRRCTDFTRRPQSLPET